jgi:glycerol-3-phosphate dehydrogenase (NAD(P)+)
MSKIFIISSGGWGTAAAIMLHNARHAVTLWSFSEAEAESLRNTRENPFLPGVTIPEGIFITNDPSLAAGADFVVNTTVSKFTRETLTRFIGHISPGQVIVNLSKGIEDGTLLRMSEVICELFPKNRLAVLSGPSHAEEVARRLPASCVVAAESSATANAVSDLFMNAAFRVYTSHDVVGVELGGTLKNIIAVAAGVSDGMELGDNARAALITRGIAEIARLGEAMGGARETFFGLAGIGDLIVTCTSLHSRNHRAGFIIGQGGSPDAVIAQVGTVEGAFAARSALALAERYGVEMPITAGVVGMLFEGKSSRTTLRELMGRERNVEFR